MAVPGEDQRDWDFARQHSLPIIETVKRPAGWVGEAYGGDGIKINSGFLDGLTVAEAKRKAIDWLVVRGLGVAKVNYRLRDWGISRQRYWGAPIPVLYCEKDGMVPEDEKNLPVVLPQDVQLSGKGGSPLAEVASFVNATCPRCGGKARRETDTMDTFVESSWYFLRYCSPRFDRGMFERGAAEYWMPVDQYIGGIEHAVLHRLFSLFAAPPEKDLDWNDHGVEGASRFLNRVWRFVVAHADALKPAPATSAPSTEPGKTFRRQIHETIAKATQDIERDFHFNTAISAVMELVNALYAFEATSHDGMPAAERAALMREAVETTLLLLGPFCPHVTEELWAQLGHRESLFMRPWPEADPVALVKKEVTLVVQVDGKVRSRLQVDVGTPEERIQRLALADDRVQPWVRERSVERVVVVANRLVNIVTRA